MYLFPFIKFLELIIVLIVGIIIRSNTNESNLDQIFKQIRKINHDRNMSKTKVISGHFLSGTSSSFDADVMFHKELTPARRILYRGIMGAVPALCSTFLTQKVIGYLSTASGFLAPPFVIIFPCIFFEFHKKRLTYDCALPKRCYFFEQILVYSIMGLSDSLWLWFLHCSYFKHILWVSWWCIKFSIFKIIKTISVKIHL